MSKYIGVDTLKTFEELVSAGQSEELARLHTKLLVEAAEPDFDLKMAFDKIDKKFDLIDKRFELVDKDFMYLRLLCVGIIIAIAGIFIKGSI